MEFNKKWYNMIRLLKENMLFLSKFLKINKTFNQNEEIKKF